MEGPGGIPISPLRALQTTHNPPETAAVGARRPRRGATPRYPVKAANIMLPIGLTVLAFIRPDFSGGASRGGGREAPSQGERSEPGGEQNLFCDPEPRPGEAEDGAANERPARGGRGGKGEPKGSTRAEDSPKGSASPYPRQTNVWRGRLIWRGLGGAD